MPSCVFRGCTNYTLKVQGKNVSFHALPTDGVLKQKWLNVIKTQRCEKYWLPTAYTKVCSKHFSDDDIYMTKKNYRRIKKTAVPIISQEDLDYFSSPTILEHVQVSEEGSIFESPRKVNLKKKITKLSKCNNLKQLVSGLQQKYCFTIDQINELILKAEAVEFIKRLTQKGKIKDYRQKYTRALRKFAVTLHYYSVAAYKYVRQIFNGSLPHPRVVGKWYENRKGDPGFNKDALDVLERKYKNSGQRILCALIADVMALRHQTKWTGKKTAGVVDFGAGPAKSCEIATQAYVFLLVCMNESWKIPVAYFLVNGLSAETRANLLKTCLSECYRVGVDIIAITFDGCSSNINAATLLGCDLKQPSNLKTTFGHPECNLDVAIMFDPCHMVKLVRNSFESKRQFFDGSGRKIRWQSLENLVKLQKNVGLNFANKITPRHIYFRNQVMTVKLATQIMSMRVANALKLCDEILTSSLFVDTEGTVDFIEMLNHLFEIFNSKSSDLYGMKKPLSLKTANDIIVFLEIAKQYILNLYIFTKYRHKVGKKITIKIIKKKIVASKHKTGFLGFLVCIESLKHLYTTLIEGQRLQHIATHRFSQDHIEILFGAIRRHGVYNNNPNVMQFKGIFKKILQRSKTKSSFLGNCLSLEDTALTCLSGVDNINSTVSRRTMDEEIYSIENDSKAISAVENVIETNVAVFSAMLNQESVKTTTKQIVGYISGWVSRKLATVLKCLTCIDSLYSNNKLWFHKLIILKTMGGLCFSSEDVFQICLKSESIIKNCIKEMGHTSLPDHRDIQILKNRILKSFIGCNDVFSCLHQHSLEQHPTYDHRVQLIRAVIDKFIHVRLHFAHKTSKSNYKRQKTNKLSLFEGI